MKMLPAAWMAAGSVFAPFQLVTRAFFRQAPRR